MKFKSLFVAIFALVVLVGCTKTNQQKKDNAESMKKEEVEVVEDTDMATTSSKDHPWLDCATIADAEEMMGFKVFDISELNGNERTIIQYLNNKEGIKAVQLVFGDEGKLRKAELAAGDDISGDYNEYSYTEEVMDEVVYTIKGNEDGVVNNVSWKTDNNTYSITSTSGLSLDDVAMLVKEMTSFE